MAVHTGEPKVIYPDSDGEPMADNTLQFEWIVTIEGGLDAHFRNDPDVFVAGDLLWYAVEGDNKIRLAPDAMVAFGRPKGYRGSYRQWEENNIAPQVVFEVLSPGNTRGEMVRKRQWYERYGVEEYYEYDPDHGTLKGWLRQGAQWGAILRMQGWVSPRLGIRFDLEGTDLVLIGPDGQRFESYVALVERRSQAEARAQEAISRAEQAEAQTQVAIGRATEAEERAKRLEARLKELGVSTEL
jgi:Uma2 family endonuclease